MKEMSLTDHLEELRKIMVKVVLVLVISFFGCYAVGDIITDFLLVPLRAALQDVGTIVYLGILDKVLAQFQVAFWSSILVASPVWFYLIWTFLRPGLYKKEIKLIRPFIIIGFVLFWIGVCFGYYLVFPLTFETLMSFGVGNIEATISLKEYLVLASKVLVFLGLIFQLPNVLLILGFMGIVNKAKLREWRRYVYVGFAVISAALTPPDVITMLGLWLPLALLYEVGILTVAILVKENSSDLTEV